MEDVRAVTSSRDRVAGKFQATIVHKGVSGSSDRLFLDIKQVCLWNVRDFDWPMNEMNHVVFKSDSVASGVCVVSLISFSWMADFLLSLCSL